MSDFVYVIYNRLSRRYGSVFSSATNATAIRYFLEYLKRFEDNPDDYELCSFGRFDIETGNLINLPLVRVDMNSTGRTVIDAIERSNEV